MRWWTITSPSDGTGYIAVEQNGQTLYVSAGTAMYIVEGADQAGTVN